MRGSRRRCGIFNVSGAILGTTVDMIEPLGVRVGTFSESTFVSMTKFLYAMSRIWYLETALLI